MKHKSIIPHIFTSLRIVLTPIFAWMFMHQDHQLQVLSVVVFTLAALTDGCDGYFARRFDVVSWLGGFMDPLADKILVTTALSCLVLRGVIPWWPVVAMVLRDLLVTILRLLAKKQGGSFETMWLAKAKTTAQFMALYVGFGVVIYALPELMQKITVGLMIGVAGVTVYTGLLYVKRAMRD